MTQPGKPAPFEPRAAQARFPRNTLVTTSVLLLLILTACGSDPVTPTQQEPSTSSPTVDVDEEAAEQAEVDRLACLDGVGDFHGELTELDSRLSVGLVFTDYAKQVSDVRVAYDAVKWTSLPPDCITEAGIPLENAMNSYLKAHTRWNKCNQNLGCSQDSITKDLQAHWADATREITDASKYLDT